MQSSAQTLARLSHQKISRLHRVFRRDVLGKNIHHTTFCILDTLVHQMVHKCRVRLGANAVHLQKRGKKALSQTLRQTTK